MKNAFYLYVIEGLKRSWAVVVGGSNKSGNVGVREEEDDTDDEEVILQNS